MLGRGTNGVVRLQNVGTKNEGPRREDQTDKP